MALAQLHAASGDSRRASVDMCALKTGTETIREVSLGESLHPLRIEAAKSTDARRGFDASLRIRGVLSAIGGPQHAFRIRQFAIAEESRLPIPDRQARPTAGGAIVMEEEHADVSAFGVAIDENVILEG